MAKIVLQTGPAAVPVSAEDVRNHSRIDSHDEDDQLAALTAAAQTAAEEYTWSKFITQTWDQYFDSFTNILELRFPPAGTVAHVHYIDTDGVEQTLSTDVWEQGEVDGIGVVRRKFNQSWPTDVRSHPDSVIVRFSCGYGDADDVPQPIKQAIEIHAAHYYEFREGEENLPSAFKHLLGPFTYREPS